MYFIVYQDVARGWRWRLHDGDARVMHQPDGGYIRKSECVAAVQAFRERLVRANIVEEGEARPQRAMID
jgi:uncharacterized protein YegP (UPF0339 family)